MFATALANACLAEYDRWDKGAGRETWGTPDYAKDYYLFVKDYWKSISKPFDGRTLVEGIRPAWSSAFVSYCVRNAGAGKQFKYSEAHCHYIYPAMQRADGLNDGYGYIARKPEAYAPKVGDIVCAGRLYAKNYTYDQAKLRYQADSFYPSHGDVVTDVGKKYVRAIGGNIRDNVDMKKLETDANGLLKPREGKYPWICVLECVIP
ncbi:DUF2272 domain-containing protein [Hyphomonas sp.]|uniref:DUF2272 domain-containing protein n=1 Tax=Hyphomonas sp. TaxID=87 RepID=UPI00391C48FC